MIQMTVKRTQKKIELSMSSCLKLKISMNKMRYSAHQFPQRATTLTRTAPANKAKRHVANSKVLNR